MFRLSMLFFFSFIIHNIILTLALRTYAKLRVYLKSSYPIKALSKGNDVGGNRQLVAFIPAAGCELLGLDGLEAGQVEEGQLIGYVLWGYTQRRANYIVPGLIDGRCCWQAVSFVFVHWILLTIACSISMAE